MTDKDLLSIVQPSEGWFAVLGIKGENDVKQKLVATREEVERLAQEYVDEERNVYFGVAKFVSNANRKKLNVKGLQSFWLDIDCGESKVAINPQTGRPEGYIDQATGLQELRTFCQKLGLPRPLLVNSGRGIHAYWPLTKEITREQWEPVAHRIRELCVIHNFHIDGKVFEVARVLRIPGTYNFKDNPPTLVSIISDAQPIDFEEFKSLLGVKDDTVTEGIEQAPRRELTELAKAMMQNVASSFKKIMLRGEKGCKQLNDAYENRDTLSEPRWFDALSIAKFCSDRDVAIHKLSQGHPDYDPSSTEAKVSHIVGPHTCVEFEKSNPGGCEGCPHKGKIKSPILLGREIVEATEDDDTEDGAYKIPVYPQPFFRGKNGGVYRYGGEEEDPVLVYEHDLYVVKRMQDPLRGDVVLMRLHLPQDGVREFVIPNTCITDKTELRKELSSHGVVSNARIFILLMEYILLSIKELQFKRRAEQMRQQFGWADKDTKFILGDKEITVDGVFHSPPSSITKDIAPHVGSAGSLENWKEVFKMYGTSGMEPHAFAALTAFGSPLLKFLGQNGAIINVIHSTSGTGKTTILHMCNSVYGHPSKLGAIWSDTMNAKILQLGVQNNLPFTVDEITNMVAAEFSALVYSMSQGRGKHRVKASSNELRVNTTTWQCISLCSSNASFYEKLGSIKASADGEMMRLIEYKIDQNNLLDTATAKHMFDHVLMENYGHAGEIYTKWLVANLEEVKTTLLGIQAKIDREAKLTQRERFWSAVIAANITGGLAAKNLGLIDWDMKAIYQWAAHMITSLRVDVKPPASDVVTIIGDYINRHMQNILVVNDEVDRRTSMAMLPTLEPRGELLIRYEPDTKKMFLAAKAFKDDCVALQINYKDTLAELQKKGVFVGTANKRLSKGMKVISPGVHSLILDCANNEFLDIDNIVKVETSNEGGAG